MPGVVATGQLLVAVVFADGVDVVVVAVGFQHHHSW